MYSGAFSLDQDPYELLQIPVEATPTQIKKAFRKLARDFHPDKPHGDADKFKNINEAYEILSDSVRRATYDKGGFRGLKVEANHKAQKSRREAECEAMGIPAETSGGMNVTSQGWKVSNDNQMFNDLFTHFFRKANEQKREQSDPSSWGLASPIYETIMLTLKEVYTGTHKTLKYHRNLICQGCYGKGYRPTSHPESCAECQGQGIIKNKLGIADCLPCQGRGKLYEPSDQCPTCEGKATISQENQLEIEIKPGMNEKVKLKYERLGHEELGKNTGDLVINFNFAIKKTASVPNYEIEGNNLRLTQKITLAEALLGVKRDLPFIDGSSICLMTEPNQSVQPDEIKIYKGGGLPVYEDPSSSTQKYGDLHVQFQIIMPKKLTNACRQAICQLLTT